MRQFVAAKDSANSNQDASLSSEAAAARDTESASPQNYTEDDRSSIIILPSPTYHPVQPPRAKIEDSSTPLQEETSAEQEQSRWSAWSLT